MVGTLLRHDLSHLAIGIRKKSLLVENSRLQNVFEKVGGAIRIVARRPTLFVLGLAQ
jgi:hypothetical protein